MMDPLKLHIRCLEELQQSIADQLGRVRQQHEAYLVDNASERAHSALTCEFIFASAKGLFQHVLAEVLRPLVRATTEALRTFEPDNDAVMGPTFGARWESLADRLMLKGFLSICHPQVSLATNRGVAFLIPNDFSSSEVLESVHCIQQLRGTMAVVLPSGVESASADAAWKTCVKCALTRGSSMPPESDGFRPQTTVSRSLDWLRQAATRRRSDRFSIPSSPNRTEDLDSIVHHVEQRFVGGASSSVPLSPSPRNRALSPFKRSRSDSTHGSDVESQVVSYLNRAMCEHEGARCERWEVESIGEEPPPRIQFSNSLRAQRAELTALIERLGGAVDGGRSYSPTATHLVVAEGYTERTEKYLSFCAARKPIVTPRYLRDGVAAGEWLQRRMGDYDTNPVRGMPTPPFLHWKVAIVGPSAVERGVANILAAGGCTRCWCSTESEAWQKHLQELTHVLVDLRLKNSGDVESASSNLPLAAASFKSTSSEKLSRMVPQSLLRLQPQLQGRLFSLELIFVVLCSGGADCFGQHGKLLPSKTLPPACYVTFQ